MQLVVRTVAAVDVPVQYFESMIAIELAVAGALLWQIHSTLAFASAQECPWK